MTQAAAERGLGGCWEEGAFGGFLERQQRATPSAPHLLCRDWPSSSLQPRVRFRRLTDTHGGGRGGGEPLLTCLTTGKLPVIEFPLLSPLLEAAGLWPRCPVQAQDDSEVKGHLLVSRVWLQKVLSAFVRQLKASLPCTLGRDTGCRLRPAPHCLCDWQGPFPCPALTPSPRNEDPHPPFSQSCCG